MKVKSIKKRGRKGSVIYSKGRYGNVAREYVPPANPRTVWQQAHRNNVRAVTPRWRKLSPDQKAAWRAATANRYFINDEGCQVRRNGYQHFVSLNVRRADLGLPQFDLPVAEPVFQSNPAVELVAAFIDGVFTLKLRLSGPPAEFTLVRGAAPVRASARWVQHFPFLGLLPPPINDWSDITELYVARFGVPKVGQAIWIRTCQHIDGWQDVPKVLHVRVRAAAA